MKVVFLYIFIIGSGSSGGSNRYKVQMPTLKICQDSINKSKLGLAQGAENELGFVMFCGFGKMRRYYNQTWWTAEEK